MPRGGGTGRGPEAQTTPGPVSIKVDGTLSPPAGAETLTAAPVKGAIALEAQDMAAPTGLLLGPSPALSGPAQGRRPPPGRAASPRGGRGAGAPPGAAACPLHGDPQRLQSRPLAAHLSGGSVTL